MRIRATRETILAKTMERGERKSAGGIVIPDDNGTDSGIRPRWCQVYDVGVESEFKDDIRSVIYVDTSMDDRIDFNLEELENET